MYEMLFGSPPFKGENHIHLLRVIETTDDANITFPTSIVIRSSNARAQGIKGMTGHRVLSSTLQISVSEVAKDLIKKLLIKDPAKRISFNQFFEHPFLAPFKMQKTSTTPFRHSRSSSSTSQLTVLGKESMLTSLLSLSIENDLVLEALLAEIDQQSPVIKCLVMSVLTFLVCCSNSQGSNANSCL